MSELDLTSIVATSIATPASGVVGVFHDTTVGELKVKDSTGFVKGFQSNFSTASQALAATTRTYITGSLITIPTNKLQIGTCFEWAFTATKTAAGTAASTIDIAVGTNGTTADTARVSFTKPAGTAAVDEALFRIWCICRGPLSASGVFVGHMMMAHNGNTAGHATIPTVNVTTVSAAFDVTVASLKVGLCITTGASDAITIQMCQASAWNL